MDPPSSSRDPNQSLTLYFHKNWVYRGLYRARILTPAYWDRLQRAKLFRGLEGEDKDVPEFNFFHQLVMLLLFVLVFFHLVPFLLALVDGVALKSSGINLPFIYDLTQYGFSAGVLVLLLSTPLFTEVQNFVFRELVDRSVITHKRVELTPKVAGFNAWRTGAGIQLLLLFLSVLFPYILRGTLVQVSSGTWHAIRDEHGVRATYSFYYVSTMVWPFCLFLIFNWVVNGLHWLHFVYWFATKKPLHINPFHPDRCGGLHSFKYSVLAWSGLIVAVGLTISLDTVNYLRFMGASITRWDILAKLTSFVILAIVIFLGPMACLTRQLYYAKIRGERISVVLATHCLSQISRKLKSAGNGSSSPREPEQATKIPQEFKDLGALQAHFDKVSDMKLWPLDLVSAAQLIATILGPLSLTMIPGLRRYLLYLGKLME